MKPSARFLLAGFAAAALLTGCNGKKDEKKDAPAEDSALTGALDDQIMVDPELAGQKGAAVSAGPVHVDLPPDQRGPEAIAAARADAAKLVGGTLKSVPDAGQQSANSLVEAAATAAQVAQAAKVGKVDCAGKVQYSMNWVNDLPPALAVYPRGAVQEAAGTDSDGCSLRVVNFVTPVSTDDVMNFYYTRLRQAGYSSTHRMDGKDHVLGGNNGQAAYLVFARKLDNGLTGVDIVSSGK